MKWSHHLVLEGNIDTNGGIFKEERPLRYLENYELMLSLIFGWFYVVLHLGFEISSGQGNTGKLANETIINKIPQKKV